MGHTTSINDSGFGGALPYSAEELQSQTLTSTQSLNENSGYEGAAPWGFKEANSSPTGYQHTVNRLASALWRMTAATLTTVMGMGCAVHQKAEVPKPEPTPTNPMLDVCAPTTNFLIATGQYLKIQGWSDKGILGYESRIREFVSDGALQGLDWQGSYTNRDGLEMSAISAIEVNPNYESERVILFSHLLRYLAVEKQMMGCPNSTSTTASSSKSDPQKNKNIEKETATVQGSQVLINRCDLIKGFCESKKIYFGYNKVSIDSNAAITIDAVVKLLRENPRLKLQIQGHTDDQGGDEYNLKLSQLRADAIRNYIISKEIDPNRLEAVGFGKTKPLVEGKTEEAREKNRRVAFVVIP